MEILLVIFLISLIYVAFANIQFKYNNKNKTITLKNICKELKSISKNGEITKIQIYLDQKLSKQILLKSSKKTEKVYKFNIDYKNVYYFDKYNDITQKEYEQIKINDEFVDLLFEFKIRKNGFCEKFIFKEDEEYYIQNAFEQHPVKFDLSKYNNDLSRL